jgi:hypothetical protein
MTQESRMHMPSAVSWEKKSMIPLVTHPCTMKMDRAIFIATPFDRRVIENKG